MLVWNTVVGGETGTTSNDNDSDNTALWHMRLGHMSKRGMMKPYKRTKAIEVC